MATASTASMTTTPASGSGPGPGSPCESNGCLTSPPANAHEQRLHQSHTKHSSLRSSSVQKLAPGSAESVPHTVRCLPRKRVTFNWCCTCELLWNMLFMLLFQLQVQFCKQHARARACVRVCVLARACVWTCDLLWPHSFRMTHQTTRYHSSLHCTGDRSASCRLVASARVVRLVVWPYFRLLRFGFRFRCGGASSAGEDVRVAASTTENTDPKSSETQRLGTCESHRTRDTACVGPLLSSIGAAS